MILYYPTRTDCTIYNAAKSMFAAPSMTLESDESVNGAATDEADGRRIDPAELVRFNRDRWSGAKPHSHTRQGTGERGRRGLPSGPLSCRHAAAANVIMHRQADSAVHLRHGKGGLPGCCLLYDHAARRGALPVGRIG